MNILPQLIGYLLFIPFITFYSFILGPVLKCVFVPGGLGLLAIILGPKQFIYYFKRSHASKMQAKKSIQAKPS